MLPTKEEFPKEPIEILKDVLPSEEFKKLASLNQERLRCMAEADGLMGEVIEIESKLLVQLNKIRSIEAEIMLKSTSPKMQEADRACAYLHKKKVSKFVFIWPTPLSVPFFGSTVSSFSWPAAIIATNSFSALS